MLQNVRSALKTKIRIGRNFCKEKIKSARGGHHLLGRPGSRAGGADLV
jgi:hypothetical protein